MKGPNDELSLTKKQEEVFKTQTEQIQETKSEFADWEILDKQQMLSDWEILDKSDFAGETPISETVEKYNETQVILEEHIEKVKENMPSPIPEGKVVNGKKKVAKRKALPDDMQEIIKEISGWKKVKAETSMPVQAAVKKLVNASDDAAAAAAMSEVVLACVVYMNINGKNIFKSPRRKALVTELITKCSDFIGDAGSVYAEEVEKKLADLSTETIES